MNRHRRCRTGREGNRARARRGGLPAVRAVLALTAIGAVLLSAGWALGARDDRFVTPTLPEGGTAPPARVEKPGPGGPVVDAQNPPETAAPETEVVGFTLQGSRSWHRLTIDDLDVLVTPGNRRLLPLLRLLKAFRVELKQEAGTLTFQVEGANKTALNVAARRIRLNGSEGQVEVVEAISDITLQREIYLPQQTIAEIFAVQLEWDEEQYAFVAQAGRHLKMWDLMRTTLADIEAVDEMLPEALPCARPSRDGLQFMELEVASQLSVLDDRDSLRDFSIDGLRQTFWGTFQGGRYKLRFTEPQIFIDREGYREIDADPIMLDWGEWTYRFPTAEIALGDSTFGVSNLVFPSVTMTGVRASGILGPVDGNALNGPSPGLRSYFVQPYDFEGYARAGSRVQLLINDRVVEQRDVVADSPTKPGQGAYRFEDIRLSPGVLNDVRIVIADPDGVETQIRKRIVPTSVLLPKGTAAWLGALGTFRDRTEWRGGGVLGAGRILYGLTDDLTVGGAVACHQDFFDPEMANGDALDQRGFPQEGILLGGQAAWKPIDALLVSAEGVVGRHDENGGSFDDAAINLQTDLYPAKDLHLGARFFRYSPGFFNGQNLDLHDRQGYALSGSWRPHPEWTFNGAVGSVHDNLDGELPDTLTVDFQHLEVASSAIPRTRATLAFDRTEPSATGVPQSLWTVRGRSQLPWGITFYGEAMTGDFLTPEANPQFFSGLAISGLSLYQGPAASATLIKNLTYTQAVGTRYWKAADRQRASLVHTYRSPGVKSVQLRTEVGMDVFRRGTGDTEGKHNCFFENRTEYLMDPSGRNRVGLLSRLERDEWTVLAFASFSNRFAFPEGKAVRIADTSVHPDRGGVHGKVFLDYNANARLDPGEPGLADVKIALRKIYTAVTDSDGYYVLPGLRATHEVRVALDLDTVPAIYTPTHGTQMADVQPRSLTRVDLGVAPAHSISGTVLLAGQTKDHKPLSGVRVCLKDRKEDALVADSVTAGDGSYYLGNVVSGHYVLRLDFMTLPKDFTAPDPVRKLDMPPSEEPQDLTVPPILVAAKVEKKPPPPP